MNVTAYEDYEVGDPVWCLAWIGMPFEVVGKDDATRSIQIDGTAPCSLPEGARLDLLPQNHHLLTKEHWDQIWYWPDIRGEHYLDVVERFVAGHHEGQLVTAHAAGSVTVEERPTGAMSFRLSFREWRSFNQIKAEPVAPVAGDDRWLAADAVVPDDVRWEAVGPRVPLEIEMIGYRWALTWGRLVLNWSDF